MANRKKFRFRFRLEGEIIHFDMDLRKISTRNGVKESFMKRYANKDFEQKY